MVCFEKFGKMSNFVWGHAYLLVSIWWQSLKCLSKERQRFLILCIRICGKSISLFILIALMSDFTKCWIFCELSDQDVAIF